MRKKYLENVRNKQFLKVTNSLFELEKDLVGLNGRALKDRKKNKREIEQLFHNPVIQDF